MPDISAELFGKRIVVVEDDYLLASDICRELREHGATVLGPAPTPFYATQLIGNRKIDAAVLDVRLHGATVYEVADLLVGRGVPIIFATAVPRAELPKRFQMASVFQKPLDRSLLLAEIVSAIKRPSGRPAAPPAAFELSGLAVRPEEAFARALARTFRAR